MRQRQIKIKTEHTFFPQKKEEGLLFPSKPEKGGANNNKKKDPHINALEVIETTTFKYEDNFF